MPLWGLADILLKGRKLEQEKAQRKAAEVAVEEEVERPAYTPEEEQEIKQLWSEQVRETEIDGTVVSKHIDSYIDNSPPEKLEKFAYYLLKPSFDLSKERALELAKVVIRNKGLLKSSFYNLEIRNKVREKINQQRNGLERNVTAVVLSEPRRYAAQVFNFFYKRPPGGKPFLTPEEWERGHQPPRRRGPTA